MWFPNGSMKIEKPRFKVNDRVVYTGKDGNEYVGTIVENVKPGPISGFVCSVVFDEPYNGMTNYRIKEEKLLKYKNIKKENKND